MRKAILMFGALCGFLGFYFLPVGQDIMNFLFIEYLGHGDYWTGMAYMYAVSGVLLALFFTITCKGLVNAFGGPLPFCVLLGLGIFICFETMRWTSGVLGI